MSAHRRSSPKPASTIEGPRLRRRLLVQCIYEYDAAKNVLASEEQAGSGVVEHTHPTGPGRHRGVRRQSAVRQRRVTCTACTSYCQPDVRPVGAIGSEELDPDGAVAPDPSARPVHRHMRVASEPVLRRPDPGSVPSVRCAAGGEGGRP